MRIWNKIKFLFYVTWLIILGVNFIVFGQKNTELKESKMNIKIIYDNTAIKGFKADWGFSCLINDSILFDTGAKPKIFATNFKKLGCKGTDIKIVFISHKHYDHIGGLEYLAKSKDFNAKIYCTDDTRGAIVSKFTKYKFNFIASGENGAITENIFSSGIIKTKYKEKPIEEQFLIIKNQNKIGLIVGCSHPGIEKMVAKALEMNPESELSFVIGGFHFVNWKKSDIRKTAEKLKEMGLRKAGASHCSGEKTKVVFKEVYGKDYIEVDAGREIDLEELFK